MPWSRIQRYLLGVALVCFVLLAASWIYLRLTIQADVERLSVAAQQSFPRPGSDVSSLVAFVQSSQHSLRERNQAVWALGQLRDPAALPALQAAYTGEPCNHGEFLCQRELKKAIALCRGETPNILLIHARRTER